MRRERVTHPDCCVCQRSLLSKDVYCDESLAFRKIPRRLGSFLNYPPVICTECGLQFCKTHANIHTDVFCVWLCLNNNRYRVLPGDWREINGDCKE